MSLTINKFWLCNYANNVVTTGWSSGLQTLWNCDWNTVLRNNLVEQVIREHFTNIDLSQENEETLLLIAIGSLQAFVQDNFVGPSLTDDAGFKSLPYHRLKIDNTILNNYLHIDGIELNCNVKNGELLALAKLLLNQLKSLDNTDIAIVSKIWYLRYCYIHQLVIDEYSETLFTNAVSIGQDVLKYVDASAFDVETRTLICLEITQNLLHYRRVWRAEETLAKTRDILGATVKVEGRLGVRTKFQQKPLPQLLLKIEVNENVQASVETHATSDANQIPTLLHLGDDVRLEKVKFIDPADNEALHLSSVAQAFVQSTFQFIQKSQPKDKLADEELLPYLDTLLQQEHGPWPIRVMTLLNNILFEASHKRTVERSLRQCEELLKTVTSKEQTNIFYRLSFVYASYIQPQWFIRSTLGDLMVSLGLIKSALDLYLQIQKWDSVISCYTILELKHKAAEIIRNELVKKETVELYCLLGDATDDIIWYEKAWEFSNQRSGRAQRHLGCYYFARKEYEQAIPYLEKSLTINSLQENVLARLGYAALALERWELAAHAYRQYTNIEPNGFESWNNLAKAYINLGDKKRAHKILNEAIRCNFDNWRVWENFLIVSVDTGNFEDGLNAHQRLTDLKGKYLDKEILGLIVNAIKENLPDAEGRPSSRLATKALKILAQLCVQYPTEGVLSEYAAQITIENPLAKAQKLQKAYRSYTQSQGNWSARSDTIDKVLNLAKELCEASLAAYAQQDDSKKSIVLSQLSSARLSAQGCLRAKKDDSWNDVNDVLEELQLLLEKITPILTENM